MNLRLPRGLWSEGDSGEVSYEISGPFVETRGFFISTAPYWFCPLILVPLFACALPGPPPSGVRFILIALAGVAMALPLAQIDRRQPDLNEYGFVPSVVAVLWMWLGHLAVVLHALDQWRLTVALQVFLSAWDRVVRLVGAFL